MPRDYGVVPMTALADSPNTPSNATIIHIFVDTTNADRLSAKMSDGSVKAFKAGATAVTLQVP